MKDEYFYEGLMKLSEYKLCKKRTALFPMPYNPVDQSVYLGYYKISQQDITAWFIRIFHETHIWALLWIGCVPYVLFLLPIQNSRITKWNILAVSRPWRLFFCRIRLLLKGLATHSICSFLSLCPPILKHALILDFILPWAVINIFLFLMNYSGGGIFLLAQMNLTPGRTKKKQTIIRRYQLRNHFRKYYLHSFTVIVISTAYVTHPQCLQISILFHSCFD